MFAYFHRRPLRGFGACAAILLLTACAQTTRVDETQTTPLALASKGTGVAVMRLGAASHTCQHVQVLIGVREGNHYRGVRGVKVAHVRSVSDSAVAEVELPPEEYHFLAYRCFDKAGKAMTVGDTADVANLYRTSIAKFTLRAGEVVNVGYLHYNAVKTRSSMFGRPVRQEVQVSDWPLEEIERFRKNRPEIFARMTTRLMVVTLGDTLDVEGCERLRELQRQGKVAKVPDGCTPPAEKTAKR
jgi:hypothetical protein